MIDCVITETGTSLLNLKDFILFYYQVGFKEKLCRQVRWCSYLLWSVYQPVLWSENDRVSSPGLVFQIPVLSIKLQPHNIYPKNLIDLYCSKEFTFPVSYEEGKNDLAGKAESKNLLQIESKSIL